jgi:histidinol dehydrogenase
MGINLYPDDKHCSFDCPYCEVFPFKTDYTFSLEQMEADLRQELSRMIQLNVPVKDICFSGNGEPSISPNFSKALNAASLIRDKMAPEAEMVVITNGTGLLSPGIFSVLCQAANGAMRLKIWLKLDAGTPEWYTEMNRSSTPYQSLIDKIKEFVSLAPVSIQTMLCSVNGKEPIPEEVSAWEKLVLELTRIGMAANPNKGNVRDIQIYGKARPAPEDPLAEALPQDYLDTRKASLEKAIAGAGLALLIQTFP